MIYLTGSHVPAVAGRQDVGLIVTPDIYYRKDVLSMYPVWAADNACFNQGARFKLNLYLAWLEAHKDLRSNCLFAVAPDVVGNAVATDARSMPVLPQIRALGYRAAYVSQDGMHLLPVHWDAFDVLFIGGTNAWKRDEHMWAIVREAKRRGKWVHNGRVNSLRRLRASAMNGCDSADGTFLRFGPDVNTPRMLGWLDSLCGQAMMQLHELGATNGT